MVRAIPTLLAFIFWSGMAHASDFNFNALGGKGGSSAKCFLSGDIRPLDAKAKKGFQALENRIRLNFEADDPQTCERYIKSYCHNNIIGRGDVPLKLRGYFRPAKTEDRKPTHVYEVTSSCKIIVE